jgi:hypothetical protein
VRRRDRRRGSFPQVRGCAYSRNPRPIASISTGRLLRYVVRINGALNVSIRLVAVGAAAPTSTWGEEGDTRAGLRFSPSGRERGSSGSGKRAPALLTIPTRASKRGASNARGATCLVTVGGVAVMETRWKLHPVSAACVHRRQPASFDRSATRRSSAKPQRSLHTREVPGSIPGAPTLLIGIRPLRGHDDSDRVHDSIRGGGGRRERSSHRRRIEPLAQRLSSAGL